MKSFIKDYLDMCKNQINFIKKHWIGCVVYTIICVAVMFISNFGPDWIDSIKSKIRKRKTKTEKSDEDDDYRF